MREWLDLPVRAYHLVAESGSGDWLRVVDVGSDETYEVANLGVTETFHPGSHLLGRLVPTGVAPGLMFEAAPLPIDRGTAVMIGRGRRPCLDILGQRVEEGHLESGFSYVGDHSLVSDLPPDAWIGALTRERIRALPTLEDGSIRTTDAQLVALRTVLEAVIHHPETVGVMRVVVAELVLNPWLWPRVQTELDGADWQRPWNELLTTSYEPARARIATMVERCRASEDVAS